MLTNTHYWLASIPAIGLIAAPIYMIYAAVRDGSVPWKWGISWNRSDEPGLFWISLAAPSVLILLGFWMLVQIVRVLISG